MSHSTMVPGYATLASALNQQGVGMTPAEMHGLLSGIVCGGNRDNSWKTLVYDLTNEGNAFSQTLKQPVEQLQHAICATLEDDHFEFQLLLPDDDDATVFERADALAGWVNHFLLGLGVTQPGLDKVTGETGEAVDDLRTIAQLGYDEEEDQQELAASLEEVIEYVRVAALLCHETFCRPQPAAVEMKKPTLH
ncbi:hypothetical protein BL250_16780 [Erwinia sp. OLTSP20]|uniref:YecA/YgfB family protein n=1 Tax=unclassified Erwinia TaxID=2622719 RepID=UPI000C18BA57|nr:MULTISPECIES: YecA family protein [unclassified Erwinia]PIJ48988.1 hypothetical protein BV501_14855 [Erwinia sp. OAMSP11]PIJ74641.1 hypothetical protein BK416_04060 [Erwinia sp. OLSSP12]PIJ79672.1 hypothetical protein BLD47_13480 [Erwinia sp. OLCASP19]PIJ80457.1 hypothetical protein BLD46_15325 [Erwinia sp. OLMTSP26]PIJ82572.1 hypothetical protein BLD49_15220 [Erwinia sp. OLMDSP33]